MKYCLFLISVVLFSSSSLFAKPNESVEEDSAMKEHRQAAQDIQDQLNSTAKSAVGYFTIQDMVVLKSGEVAELSEQKNPLKTKWIKHSAKIEKVSKIYYVDYSGKEALLTGPHMTLANLLKVENRKQQLDNGFLVRVSHLHNDDLKVWLHNPEMASYKNFKSIDFFPFSEKGVIKGSFERNETPEKVDFKDSRNEDGTMYVMGLVRFDLNGKSYSFKAYSYEATWETMKHMMIFIKDLTSGKTTYGGGRVVEFEYDQFSESNAIDINFNRAYAFLCAHSKFYNCPLVLTDKIQSKLEYGEKTSSKKR